MSINKWIDEYFLYEYGKMLKIKLFEFYYYFIMR